MPEASVKGRPPWFVKHIINPLMLLTGGAPILTVRGRKSGKTYRTPVYVVELQGQRYLTSPRGETTWSRNLRSTGELWLKMGGRETHYKAHELPPEQRAPIIAAYVSKWRQIRSDFDKLPDPADHPTFRLEAAGVSGQETQDIARA
jgi:deazaflavin-dependent oxidoreductase (nitroreductase family)